MLLKKIESAGEQDRTADLVLTKDVLYQLSYPSDERVMGIEPTSQAWKARILPLNHTRNSEMQLPLSKQKETTAIKILIWWNLVFTKTAVG